MRRSLWLWGLALALGCSPLVSRVYRPAGPGALAVPSARPSILPGKLQIIGVPGFVTVVMGQSFALSPKLVAPDGQVVSIIYDWQSDDDSVAVMQDGSLTGLKPGWTDLHFKMYGQEAHMSVQVALAGMIIPEEAAAGGTGGAVGAGGFGGGGGLGGGGGGTVPVTVDVTCDDLALVTAWGVTRNCTAAVTGSAGPVSWSLESPILANHNPALGAHSQVMTKADAGNSTTLTSVHDGSVILRASLGGVSDSVAFNVEQAVASVAVSPSLVTLFRQFSGALSEAQNEAAGAMGRYTASARDANNQVIERSLVYAWDSSSPADASADADTDSKNGKVKALAAVANNLVLSVTASTSGVTSSQTNNLNLTYSSGNVPVVVIIP